MGLKKTNKAIGLYDEMGFGRCKGSTIFDIIDDDDCSLIQYYINQGLVELNNEAYEYLRHSCNGKSCQQCQDLI